MLADKDDAREWKPAGYAGIERSPFRSNDTGGRSSAVRLAQGARLARRAHDGTEEVVVLAGAVRIGGADPAAGDDLFTAPGEEHDVVALTAGTVFVSSQGGTPIVE